MSRLRAVLQKLCISAALLAFAQPANAGVVNGVRSIDGLTVYLGVVPAAVTRAHAPQHPERTMHGGIMTSGINDVHLLVAVFKSASGQRVRNVAVTARIRGTKGTRLTVRLTPMTINGAYTYGGYASLGRAKDITISVDIARPGRTPHTTTTTAQFEYVED